MRRWLVAGVVFVALGGLAALGAVAVGGALWFAPWGPGAVATTASASPEGAGARPDAAAAPTAAAPTPPSRGACTVTRDVAYAPGLALDVYAPGGPPAPVVVYAHGGGWTTGDKARDAGMLTRWCEAGVAVVSVQYRLAPAHPYPAAVDDVRAAVAWVAAHGAEIGVDGARVGVAGTSAGAHLALMASHAPGSPVKAAVSLCGPTDLSDPFYATGHEKLGGFLAGADPRAASPVSLVDATDPPTLVVVGDRDRIVSFEENRRFVDAMTAAGAVAQYTLYPGAQHMFVNDAAWRERADADTIAWFREHL